MMHVYVCLEIGHVYLIFAKHSFPDVDKWNIRHVFGLIKARIGHWVYLLVMTHDDCIGCAIWCLSSRYMSCRIDILSDHNIDSLQSLSICGLQDFK